MDTDSNPDDHSSLIVSFRDITSASPQEALFYLESHRFDLDAAVSSFLDHRNIAGGNDLEESEEEYDEEELPQEDNAADNPMSVDDIFNQARSSAVPPEDLQKSATPKSCTGTAIPLFGNAESSAAQPPPTITHTITFWRNGFSVDNGPLRRLDDPRNASFIESIKKSECPTELEPADQSSLVQIRLNRRVDDYPERSPSGHFPFPVVGRTIGSSSSCSGAATNSPNQTTMFTAPAPSRNGLFVDDSQPFTSIQLRLADGTRMVSRFNQHHTIRDVRAFIDASRPGGSGIYQLLTMGFPPKQLTDLNQTIEQAGIGNSVVIQKA